MKPYNFDKLADLSDLFYTIIGGKPEKLEEINEFLMQNPLGLLLAKHDVEKILIYGGFFAEEQIDSIYALLPVEINIKNNRRAILYPKDLRTLNANTARQSGSRLINVDFHKALRVHLKHFNEKVQAVLSRRKELQEEQENRAKAQAKAEQEKIAKTQRVEKWWNAKAEAEQQSKSKQKAPDQNQKKSSYDRVKYFLKQATMSEDELVAQREYKTEYMRNYRKQHPFENLPEDRKEEIRAGNRRRNAKRRQKDQARLNREANERRAKLKAEDPEALRELDRKNNAKANRKKICSDYYQRHKAEINQKARENPKVKLYKKRYEIKQRLKKTGPVLLSLLYGITAAKNSR